MARKAVGTGKGTVHWRMTVGCRWWAMSVDSGQRTVDKRQWTMGSGQWTIGRG